MSRKVVAPASSRIDALRRRLLAPVEPAAAPAATIAPVGERRRLTAIVSIDVAGYARLMGKDEPGTVARWKALGREVVGPKIAEYGGRIVNTAGDNSLVEFPSVVKAVLCAVDIQRCMAKRNAGADADERLDVRIGVNVGDIIDTGDAIFGDGVNVTDRVRALAPPGGICASKVVRDQVQDKVQLRFEDLGEHAVKNIARPVEVFQVDFGEELRAPKPGIGLWQRLVRVFDLGGTWTRPRIQRSAGLPPATRLALAVLPFAAPSGRADDLQLAETLSRELNAVLARAIRLTQVLSHDLVASYKGKSFDVRTVGRELDVGYVVYGVIRSTRDRVNIDVQLIATSSGAQSWGDQVEISQPPSPEDVAGLLSRLGNLITNQVNSANMRRFAGSPAPDASAAELTYHGYSVWNQYNNTLNGLLEARKCFEKALRLDPGFLPAMNGLYSTLESELDFNSRVDHTRILAEMDRVSFRAISIDGSNPSSWFHRARSLIRQKRWEAAFEASAKAEKLSPAILSWVLNQRAGLMILTGQPEQALRLVDRELALDPQNQEELGWSMLHRCRAYMALGRHDEAIAAAEKGIGLDNWWLPHLYLVAGYALKGDTAKVEAEKATLFELRPNTSIADFKRLYYSDNPAFIQQTEAHLLAGLRKAGFPEE